MADNLLHHLFALGPAVTLAEKIIRPAIVYIFLIIGLRLAGKRELAQLNPFDLVVLLTLSNTVQNAIIGDDTSVSGGLIGAATLLGLNHIVVRYLFKHERVDRLVEGDATVLIEGGEIDRKRLAQELITESELRTAARKQGFRSLTDIERATIDPGGMFEFEGRAGAPVDAGHADLVARLDRIERALAPLSRTPSEQR